MNFELKSYLLGLAINQTPKLKEEFFQANTVYLVGSGPSIDTTPLEKIELSKTIFLNAAIDIEKKIKNNNEKYWLCQDYLRAAELIAHIPENVKKIITVNRFKKIAEIKKHLSNDDIFCQPRIGLKKMNWGGDFANTSFTLRPKIKLSNPFHHKLQDKFLTLLPDTVMLTALSIMIGMHVRNIYLLGFDAEPKKSAGISYSSAISQESKPGSGFDIEKIEAYLSKLLEEATDIGLNIKNLSPGTYEGILPKGRL